MKVIKFRFHLKNGKVFECIEKLTDEELINAVASCGYSMKENLNCVLSFKDCCVRLSECAVVEWEVLDEQETEESE